MKRMLFFFCGLLLPMVLVAQIKVTGTVKDESGDPLIGTTIVQKGTANAVITDAGGVYQISVPSPTAVLEFSYLGYEVVSMTVGTQRVINVTLKPQTEMVDEVVVVGYGTRKKVDVSGALVTLSENNIKARPVQNVLQAMQGKLAGVDIVSNNRPGSSNSITIRGNRSLKATNEPLYVVDGIVLMGTLNDLNPNDIASVTVLKDASSTAIYGSRGSNGVVLITTKSGKKGDIQVNYDGSVSWDQVNSLTDWATAGEALDRYRQAYINAGTYVAAGTAYTTPTLAADLAMFGNNDPNVIAAINAAYDTEGNYDGTKIPTTDWIGMLTRTGLTQNHLLSVSAGTEFSKLYLSAGYTDIKGTQLNQDYKRYTATMNGEIQAKKWLNLGMNLKLSRDEQNYGTMNRSGSATGANDLYGIALSQMVMAQPYDADGNLLLYPGGNNTTPLYNPLIDIDESKDLRKNTMVQANAFGEITFMPGLKYRLNFGAGLSNNVRGTWQSSQSTLRRTTVGAGASASYNTTNSYRWMVENILTYNKVFADIHALDVTLMQSAEYRRYETSSLSSSKIISDTFKWYDLFSNLNGSPDSYSTSFSGDQIMSFLGRANYTLMDKYILSATVRHDGASVLSINGQTFPAFALAWKMQNEDFMQGLTWINELKPRFSYGTTGNAAIDPYTSKGPLSRYSYVYGTTAAISYLPYFMPNKDLKWESTTVTNLGADFSLFNGRIAGSVEGYWTNTSDVILDRTLVAYLGYPLVVANIGKTSTKGLDVTVTTRNIQTKDFSWTTDWSYSRNHEEITELLNGKVDVPGNGWYIGQPFQVFRSYVVDGLWQDTPEDQAEIALWAANGYKFAPGQYKPVEQGTPDHKLTDADKKFVGTTHPDWIGGMTNTLSYKDFELSFQLYARIGQEYFSSLQPGGSTGGKYVGYVRHMSAENFWSPEHTDAEWPMLHANPTAVSTSTLNQAMYINDGSFVSVRNIGLSYNVPAKYLKAIDLKRAQIYTQVVNPFLFGGKCVQNGINPDDTNGWTSVNSAGDPTGGTNNNTMMYTSFVLGCRIGL